jgi:hypothetical protein
VLKKTYEDGTQSRLTEYGYPTEQAANADMAKWAQNNPLYTERAVMPEALVPALVEREAQT